MNQKSRQTASSKVGKEFYKLLNNSNFGIDCQNNIDNCYLEPIYDDFNEISFIKKYTTIFSDEGLRDFFLPDLPRNEIEQTFQAKIFALNKNDPTFEARKKYLERKKEEEPEAVDSFEKSKRSKKRKFKTVDEKISSCFDLRKTKMLIEFNEAESASIKSFAVRKKNAIKATTRFMSGKLLMFAKLSLKSFIYSLIEALSFPDPLAKKVYEKYQINRILCYHILTDTGSTSLQFVILSDPANDIPECDVRDIIYEVIVKTRIFKRLDTSHHFWKKFDAQKPERQKKLGLYEVENIDDPSYVTLVIKPKEYFEFFKDYSTNKKHKGIKKDSKGMDFENFAERIKSLKSFDTFELPRNEYKEVTRFMVKKREMVTTTVVKRKFSQINGKSFYFPNGILSLPSGHSSLKEISDFKTEKGQKIEKYIWEEKEKLLDMEKQALQDTARLQIFDQILNMEPKIVNSNQETDFDFLYPRKI